MFFVCLCRLAPEYEERLKNGGELELRPQEEEIQSAEWIDMEDYSSQNIWRESSQYTEMNLAMLKAARRGISNSSTTGEKSDDGDESLPQGHGFVAKKLPVGFRPGHNTIYVSKL